MKTYPIRVSVKSPRRLNSISQIKAQANVEFAKRIEAYINDEMKPMKTGTIASFEYFEISSATGVEISTVRSLLQPIDSGSHGITISR